MHITAIQKDLVVVIAHIFFKLESLKFYVQITFCPAQLYVVACSLELNRSAYKCVEITENEITNKIHMFRISSVFAT